MQLLKVNRIKGILILIILGIVFMSCNQKKQRPEPGFYKNLYTNEILTKSEFDDLFGKLHKEYFDSIKGVPDITIQFENLIETKDSIIQPFKYDVRVGKEYKVRSRTYEKIGMNIPSRFFRTINGDSIQIGGHQTKPTVINLWFIGCGGCVAEIPALNRLQEKYADKVNFIALTFDNEKDVLRFLKKKEFNYKHIASKDYRDKETSTEDYLEYIGSYPYPENIFIDRDGTIKYIEGGLPHDVDLDLAIKHFASIIDELLLPVEKTVPSAVN
jgi:thiol-disulfide isomerase/thioredoxin